VSGAVACSGAPPDTWIDSANPRGASAANRGRVFALDLTLPVQSVTRTAWVGSTETNGGRRKFKTRLHHDTAPSADSSLPPSTAAFSSRRPLLSPRSPATMDHRPGFISSARPSGTSLQASRALRAR
jgi:hypothetical protein